MAYATSYPDRCPTALLARPHNMYHQHCHCTPPLSPTTHNKGRERHIFSNMVNPIWRHQLRLRHQPSTHKTPLFRYGKPTMSPLTKHPTKHHHLHQYNLDYLGIHPTPVMTHVTDHAHGIYQPHKYPIENNPPIGGAAPHYTIRQALQEPLIHVRGFWGSHPILCSEVRLYGPQQHRLNWHQWQSICPRQVKNSPPHPIIRMIRRLSTYNFT